MDLAVQLRIDSRVIGNFGIPVIASCNHNFACTTGRRSQRSRSSARCIFRGWLV